MNSRVRGIASWLCGLALVVAVQGTNAEACGKAVPDFSGALDPKGVPAVPSEVTLTSLEIFRVQLELYRKNTVEAYNRRLLAYGDELDRLDKEARKNLASGRCPLKKYETYRDQIAERQRKIRSEYRELYDQGFAAYSEWSGWCKNQSQKELTKKQLGSAWLTKLVSEG
jgi:hypothetical protein